jgi:hypothetical protein
LVLLSDIIVCRHRSVSLNNEKSCREIIVKIKLQFVRKLQVYTERELFGFELSVFESISSRKNISVPRHGKWKCTISGRSKRPKTAVYTRGFLKVFRDRVKIMFFSRCKLYHYKASMIKLEKLKDKHECGSSRKLAGNAQKEHV